MARTFEYINNSSYDKKSLVLDDEFQKDYNIFLTNRYYSYFLDTILDANRMNLLPDLNKEQNYLYYMNKIKKKKRFSKWFKPTLNDNIELIQEYYYCNKTRAIEYSKILSTDEMEYIQKILNKGGTKK